MEQFIKHVEIKGLTGPTNPGTATWAFVVITTISTEYYHEAGYIGENITNNAAELRAFIEAIRYIEQKGTPSEMRWAAEVNATCVYN